VGEVRGGEAFDLLLAFNTGHSGTLSTIQANTALTSACSIFILCPREPRRIAVSGRPVSDRHAINLVLHLGRTHEMAHPLVSIRVNRSPFSGDHVMNIVVKITPNDRGNPPGKLADAELHFIDGELDGLKLIGFGIWERRGGNGRNVTLPARQCVVNGERRSFALLRHIADTSAQNRVRDLVLQAYAEHERETAETAP
jgi:hypothetical protein